MINTKNKRINKFRICGYAVFFSIFFKKYSKSFTINRFDEFKKKWMDNTSVTN
jgi:hypothetical protein